MKRELRLGLIGNWLSLASLAVEVPLVPSGRDAKTEWLITHSDPGEAWAKLAYRPRGWKLAPAPFGNMENVETQWDYENIWMRRTFHLSRKPDGLMLLRKHDDGCEIFLNGQQIKSVPNTENKLKQEILTESTLEALEIGPNVLAVKVYGKGSFYHADFGLIGLVEMKKATPILPPGKKEPAAWHYHLGDPPRDWYKLKCDTRDWQRGSPPMGTRDLEGGVKMRVKTESSKVLVGRTAFNLTRRPKGLVLEIAYDDDATIYLNGVRVLQLLGYTENKYRNILLPGEAVALLQPGPNLFAVRVDNKSNDICLDAGLWPDWEGTLRVGQVIAPVRAWSDKNGNKILARLVSKTDQGVNLRLADGRGVAVPYSKLSEEDLDYLDIDLEPESASSAATEPQAHRNWTIGFQRVIEARLIEQNRKEVILEDASGKQFPVPIPLLSDQDLAYLRSL